MTAGYGAHVAACTSPSLACESGLEARQYGPPGPSIDPIWVVNFQHPRWPLGMMVTTCEVVAVHAGLARLGTAQPALRLFLYGLDCRFGLVRIANRLPDVHLSAPKPTTHHAAASGKPGRAEARGTPSYLPTPDAHCAWCIAGHMGVRMLRYPARNNRPLRPTATVQGARSPSQSARKTNQPYLSTRINT